MSANIVSVDEESLRNDIKNLVRKTVEETLNALLDEEASELVGAERYERTAGREAYRSGHYTRRLVTGAGEVELSVPKLRGATFQTAVIERYRRCWHILRINDPAYIRRTRAHTSTFAPRTNPSRPIEARNARNENGVPLEPLSGVNGHHRNVCIKVIRETPQGTLGKDTNDILEALRWIHRDAIIFKVFPQRPKEHGIGLLVIESPGASQKLIRNGFDDFVRIRPANAFSKKLYLQNKFGSKTALGILKGNFCWEK